MSKNEQRIHDIYTKLEEQTKSREDLKTYTDNQINNLRNEVAMNKKEAEEIDSDRSS